jgi:hypothetical protein
MHPVKRKIFLRKQQRAETTLSENILHTRRELREFEKIAENLKQSIGELKPGDRERLEAQSWLHKVSFMIQLDLLTTGGIQRSTAEIAYSLPKNLQRQLDFKNFKKILG